MKTHINIINIRQDVIKLANFCKKGVDNCGK